MRTSLRHVAVSVALVLGVLVTLYAWKAAKKTPPEADSVHNRVAEYPATDRPAAVEDNPGGQALGNAPARETSSRPPSLVPEAQKERAAGEPLQPPPIPDGVPVPAEPKTGWAKTELWIDGQRFAPANHFGQIQPVPVAPKANIAVTVQWPRMQPGTPVGVEVVNSGRLTGGALSRLFRADDRGQIQFEYAANDQPGTCLVVLWTGFDETTFTFEVGAMPPPVDAPTPLSASGEQP